MSEKSPWLKGGSDVIGKLPGFSDWSKHIMGKSQPTSQLKISDSKKFEKTEVLSYNIYIKVEKQRCWFKSHPVLLEFLRVNVYG